MTNVVFTQFSNEVVELANDLVNNKGCWTGVANPNSYPCQTPAVGFIQDLNNEDEKAFFADKTIAIVANLVEIQKLSQEYGFECGFGNFAQKDMGNHADTSLNPRLFTKNNTKTLKGLAYLKDKQGNIALFVFDKYGKTTVMKHHQGESHFVARVEGGNTNELLEILLDFVLVPSVCLTDREAQAMAQAQELYAQERKTSHAQDTISPSNMFLRLKKALDNYVEGSICDWLFEYEAEQTKKEIVASPRYYQALINAYQEKQAA